MRIFAALIILLFPLKAFCAKNFFGGPNPQEIFIACLFAALGVACCLFLDIVYYRKKWKYLLVFNIVWHVLCCVANLIMLLFSPIACLLAYLLIGVGFVLSLNHQNKTSISENAKEDETSI